MKTQLKTTAAKDRHYICEIGRLLWGDNKQCYAADAVYRAIKTKLYPPVEPIDKFSIPDPACYYAAIISIDRQTRRLIRKKLIPGNTSDPYDSGHVGYMIEAADLAQRFNTWADRWIDFDRLGECWPYYLEDHFGSALWTIRLGLGHIKQVTDDEFKLIAQQMSAPLLTRPRHITPDRILIITAGGVVNEVYSSNPTAEYKILDEDEFSDDPKYTSSNAWRIAFADARDTLSRDLHPVSEFHV